MSYLIDMETVEAAPLMERALEANSAAVGIAGDWADMQAELGLTGQEASSEVNLDGFDVFI